MALLAAALCFLVANRASLARSGKEWHRMPFGNSFHSIYTSQNETECEVEPLVKYLVYDTAQQEIWFLGTRMPG